jgi:hypothetical protein
VKEVKGERRPEKAVKQTRRAETVHKKRGGLEQMALRISCSEAVKHNLLSEHNLATGVAKVESIARV